MGAFADATVRTRRAMGELSRELNDRLRECQDRRQTPFELPFPPHEVQQLFGDVFPVWAFDLTFFLNQAGRNDDDSGGLFDFGFTPNGNRV